MSLDDLVNAAGARAERHAGLGARTTYRVGGTAAVLVTLSSTSDLTELAPLIEAADLPVVVIGNGSNLLVDDGEHDVVAVHLTGALAELDVVDDGDVVRVSAGAGLDLPVAARRLAGAGVVGFEWAVGVPGTFGGAVVMNAGGHGSNMAASVTRAHTWRGGPRVWSAADLGFDYRSSALPRGEIVTSVELALGRGSPDEAMAEVREVVRWRRAHQPGGANAGSVFRNPPGDSAGRLIDAAGLKGRRVGSAAVSDVHANFIQADPGGSARDVFALIELVHDEVLAASGVALVRENHLLGFGAEA
ncbi:MAG: UDP-N-acetylmuramate dehydrogenase [Acidimicrobiales bacterium]